MKQITLTLFTVLTLLLVSSTSYALPLSDKAVKSEVVTTVDPPATITDAKPILTKKEKKAQRKMDRMEKRLEELTAMSAILAFIPIVGWILIPVWSLLFLIAWIIGLIGAIKGEMKPVFFFGKKYQKWFSGIS